MQPHNYVLEEIEALIKGQLCISIIFFSGTELRMNIP